MKYRKKPVVIEAITFEEVVEYGKEYCRKRNIALVDGMPWSFEYEGHPLTHENNECYLFDTLEGSERMTPKDMMITGVEGEIYPIKLNIFEKTYELVK